MLHENSCAKKDSGFVAKMLLLSCLCYLVTSCFSLDDDDPDKPPVTLTVINGSDSCELARLRYIYSSFLFNLDTVDAGTSSLPAGDTLVDVVKKRDYGRLLYDCNCPDSVSSYDVFFDAGVDTITDFVVLLPMLVDCD